MVFLLFLYVIRLRINKMCCLQGLSKLNVLDLQDNQVPFLRPLLLSTFVCVCVWLVSIHLPRAVAKKLSEQWSPSDTTAGDQA